MGDYFSKAGRNYLVLGDRYSGWVSTYSAGSGELDAEAFIKRLFHYFVTFGMPTEYASDDGPQFRSGKLQKFLKTWGVHHRQSSAYFPHSNSHMVKTAKRTLMENVGPSGELNQDAYCRVILQYRNSPLQDVRLSPHKLFLGAK